MEFPELPRMYGIRNCDIIINITASGEKEKSIALNTIPARSWENHCFIVYCNYPSPKCNGSSCITSPYGKDIIRAKQCGIDLRTGKVKENQCLLVATIDTQSEQVCKCKQTNPYFEERTPFLYKSLASGAYLSSKL